MGLLHKRGLANRERMVFIGDHHTKKDVVSNNTSGGMKKSVKDRRHGGRGKRVTCDEKHQTCTDVV